jgi:uncharacterized damage-inducible protein DinB
MSQLQTLTQYKAWADALFYEEVAALPEAELTAPRAIMFGSIVRTLHHAYAMDRVWQAHLLGKPHGYTTRNPVDHPPFNTLRRLQAEIDAWYADYAKSLSPAKEEEIVTFSFIGGGAGTMSRANIILHVVNHTTYHRGHVADMLYSVGTFPPTTDLPVFLREMTTQI